MAPLIITIRTFADTICPWSYVGNVIMHRAMAAFHVQHPEVAFELSWNPFYLFHDAEVSGEQPASPSFSLISSYFEHRTDNGEHYYQAYEKIDLYTRKIGAARAPDFFARVGAEGQALGLALSFVGRVGNTRDSHALLLFAQQRSQACMRQLQTTLFRGTFEEGQDISDRAFLLEAAGQVGLGEEKVQAWLDCEKARRLVDAMDCRARGDGIVAVPSFVVQGRYRIGGKQEERVFLELFERIWRMAASGNEKGNGRMYAVVTEDEEKR